MDNIELQHLFHEHPLILENHEETKLNDDIDDSNLEIICDGCLTPILGPFYGCRECRYLLHKVCAELPDELNHHPMHPQHPLILLKPHEGNERSASYRSGCYCYCCLKTCEGFLYHCSICKFDVDTICAYTSHVIEDKCHMHPLTLINTPTAFPCHICHKKDKEGVSYKCIVCPFWVHQRCTVLPNSVTHSAHRHLLILLPSLLSEHCKYSDYCDICHDKLSTSYGSYSCAGCLFFAHISCATSESILSSSTSRDQHLVLLPMHQKSTELISRFVDNHSGHDANIGNNMETCDVQSSDTNIDNKTINHFDHGHPLFLIDEQTNEKTCDACTIPISPPSYGCIECDYFLHKCCTEFPKHILHESHPQHQLSLEGTSVINSVFTCGCCDQLCNGFSYKCSGEGNFRIDIKCASLLGYVHHEAHKHRLTPKFISENICSACGYRHIPSEYYLQCDTCSFSLCFVCAMTPPVVNHRYGKSDPFVLTYHPPENHYDEYICEICEKTLNPKRWFYHCVFADQFTHLKCMIRSGANSNIKYGKFYDSRGHEHSLALISCVYEVSRCSYCREPLRSGLSVGFECITCNFRIHVDCVNQMNEEVKRSATVTISKTDSDSEALHVDQLLESFNETLHLQLVESVNETFHLQLEPGQVQISTTNFKYS